MIISKWSDTLEGKNLDVVEVIPIKKFQFLLWLSEFATQLIHWTTPPNSDPKLSSPEA
jgi:hypothetical protein